MKVFISCDMEGISGLVHWDETMRKGAEDYQRARRLMTADANAAAVGALDGGAAEVLVNDSHGGMRNILVEDLDERLRLISGSGKYLSMVEGVAGCDVAMFVGYHSMALSSGVMNHTYTGSVVEYRICGRVLGECGMNAYLAGQFGVPVVLVTGDREAASEARELIPDVRTVVVKEPVNSLAANLLHPARARAQIREAAAAAVAQAIRSGAPPALAADPPVRLELRLARSEQAAAAALLPRAERLDATTVAYDGADYLECFRAFRAMIALARP